MTNEVMREYCLSLPGATESINWENRWVFLVGERIFCLTGFDEGCPVAFRVDEKSFKELIARDGIIQEPNWPKRKWASVVRRNALSVAEWKEVLNASYVLVNATLPPKVRMIIDGP